MQILKELNDLKDSVKGAVVAIGNFDGVHKGHQELLKTAKVLAQKSGKKLGVLTFEPHPRRLFRPDEPPARITPAKVKLWRLQEEGVEIIYALPFNWDFASQSADDFITHILKDGIGAAHILVGEDFRFGQMRKGEPADIKKSGIPVTPIVKISDHNQEIISSSAIRQHLRHGEIAQANAMLGWEWEMRGEIIRGDQRGRELGYPTANMKLGETIHPAYGIYAARVQIVGEKEWYNAAVNIGIRPMFEVPTAQVESHILDFDRDIYGKILRVKPVERLRSEAKFKSVDELIAQMKIDCENARKVLNN